MHSFDTNVKISQKIIYYDNEEFIYNYKDIILYTAHSILSSNI